MANWMVYVTWIFLVWMTATLIQMNRSLHAVRSILARLLHFLGEELPYHRTIAEIARREANASEVALLKAVEKLREMG